MTSGFSSDFLCNCAFFSLILEWLWGSDVPHNERDHIAIDSISQRVVDGTESLIQRSTLKPNECVFNYRCGHDILQVCVRHWVLSGKSWSVGYLQWHFLLGYPIYPSTCLISWSNVLVMQPYGIHERLWSLWIEPSLKSRCTVYLMVFTFKLYPEKRFQESFLCFWKPRPLRSDFECLQLYYIDKNSCILFSRWAFDSSTGF